MAVKTSLKLMQNAQNGGLLLMAKPRIQQIATLGDIAQTLFEAIRQGFIRLEG